MKASSFTKLAAAGILLGLTGCDNSKSTEPSTITPAARTCNLHDCVAKNCCAGWDKTGNRHDCKGTASCKFGEAEAKAIGCTEIIPHDVKVDGDPMCTGT